jgi:antitoxin (DNA-binding transcriptional repressor) of toxin-antitoxin stability system
MSILIDASEFETQFDTLLDRVAQGEEFLILRHGRIVARMSGGPFDTAGPKGDEAPQLERGE